MKYKSEVDGIFLNFKKMVENQRVVAEFNPCGLTTENSRILKDLTNFVRKRASLRLLLHILCNKMELVKG